MRSSARSYVGIVWTSVATLVGPHCAFAQSSEVSPNNEIVIIGTRSPRPLKESSVPVRVIDRSEIQAAGDTHAGDALARLAGVAIDSGRTGQTPQIQGFASKHVLVLIDGRRASGRITDDFDLSRIPASQIERIEVLKGASSVLYGSDAIGGVINIITRRPRGGVHGNAAVSRDSLHRNDFNLGLSGGGENVRARTDASWQSGPSFDLEPKDIATTGSAFDRRLGKIDLNLRPSTTLEFNAALTAEDAKTSGIGVTGGGATIDRETLTHTRTTSLGTILRPDEQGEIRLELSESRREHAFIEDQRRSNALDHRDDSTERSREATLVGSRAYAEQHETVTGIELAQQNLESDQLNDKTAERSRLSGFVQHEWRPLTRLFIVPGVRHDHDSQFGNNLSKALALRYDLTEQIVLRASYGEGFRAPSFTELYMEFDNPGVGYRVSGSPNLQPERSQNVQASISWQAHPRLWSSLSVFGNRVQNLIAHRGVDRAGDGTTLFSYANTERVKTLGIESSTRLRLGEVWTAGIDYTFLRARDDSNHRSLEARAMHSGSVQVRYDVPLLKLSATASSTLVGKRPFYIDTDDGPVTRWSKPYRSASMRVAKTIDKSFELFAGMRNVTNEYETVFHPVAPRAYFGGAKAEI